jgi:ParB family chromosome partitioning protein
MERKALGKGISALIPEKIENSKSSVSVIPINKILTNPFQPREFFDEQAIKDLAQSIKEKGIIQPLLVRQKGDNYELIAGERRLRAAKLLNLNEVPIIIKDVDDKDSLELALIENIQRQELNPIEEAHAYQYLIDKFNVTQERISEVIGKARTSVTNILRLLKLPQEIQQEMKKGRISFAHGRSLVEIEDANSQRRIAQDIIAKGLSVRELENLIKMRRPKGIKRKLMKVNLDPVVAVLQEKIQQALSTRVVVVKNKKRGRIVVEFYSESDLNRIANIMTGGDKT